MNDTKIYKIILSVLCRITMVKLLAERHPQKYGEKNALSCSIIITEQTNFLPFRQM